MANGHGGARDGAGRKKHAERHVARIESFADECVAHLKPTLCRLRELIEGGERSEVEEWPAELVTRKDVARDDEGEVIRDDKGKPVIVDVRAYPDAEPGEFVVVKRRKITLQPDARAIEILFDRAMGKATQALELSNGDDGPLKIQVVYADADPPGDTPEAPRGPEEDPPGAEAV